MNFPYTGEGCEGRRYCLNSQRPRKTTSPLVICPTLLCLQSAAWSSGLFVFSVLSASDVRLSGTQMDLRKVKMDLGQQCCSCARDTNFGWTWTQHLFNLPVYKSKVAAFSSFFFVSFKTSSFVMEAIVLCACVCVCVCVNFKLSWVLFFPSSFHVWTSDCFAVLKISLRLR